MMAAAGWMKAAKLRSVLSQRMAMRFEFLELAEEVLDEVAPFVEPGVDGANSA
jgi:hypothetical protein